MDMGYWQPYDVWSRPGNSEMKDLSQFIASHMTHEKNGLSFKSLDSFLHPVFGQTQLVQLVMAWPCLKRHHGHGVESKKNTTCVNFPSKEDLWYSRSWASAKIYSRTPNCEANLVGKKNCLFPGLGHEEWACKYPDHFSAMLNGLFDGVQT